MSEYGDPGSFDPYYLLNVYLPDDSTIESRVALAAAIRNPYWPMHEIAEFADLSTTTVRGALHAFHRGTLESLTPYRGGDGPVGRHAPEKQVIDDYTKKQQAVIEFFARYPDVRKRAEDGADQQDWTWNDVCTYIGNKTGINVSPQYAGRIAREEWSFIADRNADLREAGKLEDLDEIPEQPTDLPETTRRILEDRISRDALPDENLDADHAYGVDDWIEPYTEVELHATEEAELPHTERSDEAVVEDMMETFKDANGDEEESVEIEGGNARYEGPAEGINLAGDGTQMLSEAPAHQSDEAEPEDPDTVGELPRCMCEDCGRVERIVPDSTCPGVSCTGQMERIVVDDEPEGGRGPPRDTTGSYGSSDATLGDSKLVVAEVPTEFHDTLVERSEERGTNPGRELVRAATRSAEEQADPTPTETPEYSPADQLALTALQSRIQSAIDLTKREKKRTGEASTMARLSALEWVSDEIDEMKGQDDE